MSQRNEIERQLNYEYRLALRYRYFVSIVMVASARDGVSVSNFLEETLRDCDEIYFLEEGVAILMSHTSLRDAKAATDRFKERCNERIDLRFAIASFPSDTDIESLLTQVSERLEAAMQGEFGEVVFQG